VAHGNSSSEYDATSTVEVPRNTPVFTRFAVGGNEVIVVSVPGGPAESPRLSAAEQDVFELLRDGYSDVRIAELRGTAPRTVHKQVHAIFGKLGVSSRHELLAQF
jgi:DNA-binding NarL/FixJ family response regulator